MKQNSHNSLQLSASIHSVELSTINNCKTISIEISHTVRSLFYLLPQSLSHNFDLPEYNESRLNKIRHPPLFLSSYQLFLQKNKNKQRKKIDIPRYLKYSLNLKKKSHNLPIFFSCWFIILYIFLYMCARFSTAKPNKN